jgi:methionyl-tRNA synthetase
MCKEQFMTEPHSSNICGSFCEKCTNERLDRLRSSVKARQEEKRNGTSNCVWCGDETEHHESEGSVCYRCKQNRNWLLDCIRISDRPFKYVSAREEVESKARNDRKNGSMGKIAMLEAAIAELKKTLSK